MNKITLYLSNDHDRCDTLFFQAESCVSKNQWDQASLAFREFDAAMYRHLMLEEEILFPALREALGACGPADVMRREHQQIRQIVKELDVALHACDAKEFLGAAETLNIMIQQHNFKEENMLYVMADQALLQQQDDIIDRMNEMRLDPAFDHALLSDSAI